jgi:indolepyruvate ferredoxin oxidoreductase
MTANSNRKTVRYMTIVELEPKASTSDMTETPLPTDTLPLADVSLDDKYERQEGLVFATGVQALVRVLLEQRRRDKAAGLNTAGFVSGYRGSPLGELDKELWKQKARLSASDIVFKPGINEELAATQVIGTQQVSLRDDNKVDGVFSMWYGKGPGLDRAGDALKHANSFGVSAKGGMLVVVGDDHGAVSSSLAHQCEQVMASWMMPVLHPANIQEYLEFGLLGLAMSRYSGCAVGFKAVSETVETAGTLVVDPDFPKVNIPVDFVMPLDGPHIRLPDNQMAQEARLHNVKIPAVQAFARANGFDRITLDSPKARFGIAATGKSYLYLKQALQDLGITDDVAAQMGLRIYKVGMSWPLEPVGAEAFSQGLEEVLVIEEKRSFIESQLKEILYGLPDDQRPRILGKSGRDGNPLVPTTGELDAADIARILVGLFAGDLNNQRASDHCALLEARSSDSNLPPVVSRTPYFCSGCPHNRSTKVPEGSQAIAGTGCHLLALMMNRQTFSIMHMGGEGVNWLGISPFVTTEHIFQNLGDGTYIHSGVLGLRQALADKATMTFKILFNDAVAMTGGQPLEGELTVPKLVRQVLAEGAENVAIVADDPGKYGLGGDIPAGVRIWPRQSLNQVQKDFRRFKGVSVIIYDQTCAAELRRRRKRGIVETPKKRVYINKAVCEGCGDCSVQSNCLSVMPVATPYGTKRAIDQSGCNRDFTCVEGFCPAFVTVEGATPRRKAGREAYDTSNLPQPALPALDQPYGVLIAGVGGTGVVTVGQLIGMAAHLEGKGVSILDFTGMAQKGGSVLTHLRITANPGEEVSARVPLAGAGLVIAGDMVVGAGPETLAAMRPDVTHSVINSDILPVAESVSNPDFLLDDEELSRRIRHASGKDHAHFVAAKKISEALVGDSIAGNVFLLGYAFQVGGLPVGEAALVRAIELNGASVDSNKAAFAWGRLAAHDPEAIARYAGASVEPVPLKETLDQQIERRAEDLVEFQNEALAEHFRHMVDKVRIAEAALGTDQERLTQAVVQNLFHLMAYKDEYEVARLHTSGEFMAELEDVFEGDLEVTWHLSPPLISRMDPATDRPEKKAFGNWMQKVMKVLAGLKGLRGTAFDVFGYSAERKTERALITEYQALVDELLTGLQAGNYQDTVEIADLARGVRGYGPVKETAVERVRSETAERLAAWRQGGDQQQAAE